MNGKVRNKMFGRKNKYREVVAAARLWAAEKELETTVFQQGKVYKWCWSDAFSIILEESTKPVIKLLICLPDGTVAQ